MKTPIRLLTIIIIVIFSISCVFKRGLDDPRTVILPLGDTIHLTDGSLVYGLPMTVFDVTVEVEKRIERPGPYSKFAGELLGIKDVISLEKETWSIKGVNVNFSEELDPSEFFVIESNTLFQTNALALKKAGLILDINPGIYAESAESGAGIVSKNGQSGFMDMGADEYYVTQSDTAFRIVKLDTEFIKIPYLVEKKKQLTIDQLAEKAAKKLLELRDGKHMILTGEANVFPQDKSSIDEINRMENEYLALFIGKSWSEFKTFSYTIIPQKDMSGKPTVLFMFSEKSGLSDDNSKTAVPVTVEFVRVQKTKDLSIITKPQTDDKTVQKFDKLYYRMPEVVTVNIKAGPVGLYSSRKLIYQFGEVIQLPANYIIGK
ncbi:MAG: hypothetical protein C0408_08070 [Odoribacter sp.]|nr:hypothetical protein [Odoribacter sp.]